MLIFIGNSLSHTFSGWTRFDRFSWFCHVFRRVCSPAFLDCCLRRAVGHLSLVDLPFCSPLWWMSATMLISPSWSVIHNYSLILAISIDIDSLSICMFMLSVPGLFFVHRSLAVSVFVSLFGLSHKLRIFSHLVCFATGLGWCRSVRPSPWPVLGYQIL